MTKLGDGESYITDPADQLTKLEYAAIQIAAALMSNKDHVAGCYGIDPFGKPYNTEPDETTARVSVRIATKLMMSAANNEMVENAMRKAISFLAQNRQTVSKHIKNKGGRVVDLSASPDRTEM